ncbi:MULTISPECIES: hypothetical protein [Bacillus]|uniref:hypothetical protein n=1 Tax=Bacillus TaxID=1386 RepID=UPI00148F5247|nr:MULTISPECIES: hypothetical protein [Bacillus]MBE0185610.1 hypothetical protein [Bacillus subtilis]NOV05578.1 hypothetical protein [Bacillus sp. seq1]
MADKDSWIKRTAINKKDDKKDLGFDPRRLQKSMSKAEEYGFSTRIVNYDEVPDLSKSKKHDE